MKVEVIGSGCQTCRKLHESVLKIVKEENISAHVEYSTDITRIVGLGIMSSPVLVIDGKPASLKSLGYDGIKNALLGKEVSKEEDCNSCSCGGSC